MTGRDQQIADLFAAWREADLELQLLRRSEPAEAYERADAVRIAYLQARSSGRSPFVAVRSFWILAILLVVLGAAVGRVILHR